MAVSLVFLRGGDSSHESKQPAPISYPQELEGNYMVRKMNGNDDMNATIKVYYEGEGYAMNVYSSMTTRKYTFSYNPSTGEIDSEVLGKGRARIKEYTNETEITFEGWEIVK